jgi:hypothetical protein
VKLGKGLFEFKGEPCFTRPHAAVLLGTTSPTLAKNAQAWGIQVRDLGEGHQPRFLYSARDVTRVAAMKQKLAQAANDRQPDATTSESSRADQTRIHGTTMPEGRDTLSPAPGSGVGSHENGQDLLERVAALEGELATVKEVVRLIVLAHRASMDAVSLLVAPSNRLEVS